MKPDDTLDRLLESHPVQASPSFTEDTLERIRRETQSPVDGGSATAPPTLRFKPWMIGLAAAVLVLFGLSFLLIRNPEANPAPDSTGPSALSPAIAFEPPPSREAPAASAALDDLSEAEFYALEDSLAELDVLLEENNLTILNLLASDLI